MLNPNICYEAQIKSNQLNYKQKNYTGTAKTDLKHRFHNHTKSFKLEHYENDTELSKEYWTIKSNHFTPKVTWRIIRKCVPFNTTKRKFYLCLNDKLEIPSYKVDNLLNKRQELINFTTTSYEVHTFKNKNKRKSLRDIFVYHFLFYTYLFVATTLL